MNAETRGHFLVALMVQMNHLLKGCCNYSKLDATSCNARPAEAAKVPVEIAAKRFLALLLMDPRGAERQQKQISDYKNN